MFISLLLKECRLISKSLIYFAFAGILVLFYAAQIGTSVSGSLQDAKNHTEGTPSFNPLIKPEPGWDNYGMKTAEAPQVIMPAAAQSLYTEYAANRYATYPIGFYKGVKLKEKEQERIGSILQELTGLSADSLERKLPEATPSQDTVQGRVTPSGKAFPIVVSYERFKELMGEVESMLGSSSNYSLDSMISRHGHVPMTYEERLAEYKLLVEKDKISGAYAREFSDYMGILLGFLPVFVAVFQGGRDRRAHMQELIYSRKAFSSTLVLARYTALVVMLIVPVLLLSLHAVLQFAAYSETSAAEIDLLAYGKYILGWLLPTLMVSTAVGVCLTELTDSPIAIVVQGLWWFIGLNAGMQLMKGGYGSLLVIRHNTVGNRQILEEHFRTLVLNRIGYSLLALLLVASAMVIYELKRRGKLDAGKYMGKIRSRFKSKPKTRVA
ncbi:hypothetical protein [Paenibacillus sp. FJAT-26967]|uniref:hypothetical protein n=1 Tax=Paenibacillus sp. FJAT-26967 TaxID=1729690 RepID=UPI000838479D|nr:hypothetical protein [Paenibacillus sp. FJAT-26967]